MGGTGSKMTVHSLSSMTRHQTALLRYISAKKFIRIPIGKVKKVAKIGYKVHGSLIVFDKSYSPTLPVYITHADFGGCEVVNSGYSMAGNGDLNNPIKFYLCCKVNPLSKSIATDYYIVPQKIRYRSSFLRIVKPMKYIVKRIKINRSKPSQSKVWIDELSTGKTGHNGEFMRYYQFLHEVDNDKKTHYWKLAYKALTDNQVARSFLERIYTKHSDGSGGTSKYKYANVSSVTSYHDDDDDDDSDDDDGESSINSRLGSELLDNIVHKLSQTQISDEIIKFQNEILKDSDTSPYPTPTDGYDDIISPTVIDKNFPHAQIGNNYNQESAYIAFKKNQIKN